MPENFDIRRERIESDKDFERALRPMVFDDFSGQDKVIENLRVFVAAARMRGEALDHILLHGPPGLGKTTLSNIVANELGVGFKVTSGPVLDKPGDLAGILTSLEENDVLFIDEIHRLSPVVEEYLYSAMRRGIPLLGDGRLPHRHNDRQRTRGAVGTAHIVTVHAHRCYHSQRAAHSPAEGAIWHQLPP